MHRAISILAMIFVFGCSGKQEQASQDGTVAPKADAADASQSSCPSTAPATGATCNALAACSYSGINCVCNGQTWTCAKETTNGPDCPTGKPASGASCGLSTDTICSYFLQKTQCNYLDLYSRCTCKASSWSCADDKEDCPCPPAAPDTGDSCAFPGPTTCGYPMQGGALDLGYGSGLKSCTCDGTTWTCQHFIG